MLLIRKEYFEPIRSGRKTTTLRYWRRTLVAAGSVHLVRGLGYVRVDSVSPIEAADLTDADAHADGFEDLAGLMAALAHHYPERQRDRRNLYRVCFTFLGHTRLRPDHK